jgi:hypothetical protein
LRLMRAVRVVVAEAASTDAAPVLAPILEAEGFEVVGSASSADELRDVLGTTQPQVVVFDAGMSALTVLSARDWAPGAGIVVVWPPDVLAPAADERVEPSRAAAELGDAVRRARRVYHAPPLPVVVAGLAARQGRAAASTSGPRRTLTFALASLLIVLGIAAIALQRGHQSGEVARSPSPSPSATGPTGPTGPGTPGGNGNGQPLLPPGAGLIPGVAGSGGVASTQPIGPSGPTPPGGHASGPGGPGPVPSSDGGGGIGQPDVPQGSGNTCFNGYGDSGHHGDGDSGHHGDGDSRRGNCGHQGNGSSGLHAGGASRSSGTENRSHRGNGNGGHHANGHSAGGHKEKRWARKPDTRRS